MSADRPTDAWTASREGFVALEAHAGKGHCDCQAPNPVTPDDVVSFWQEAGSAMWFARDADFDRLFRTKFLCAHEAATRDALDDWAATPNGALALLILLDQFPRNAFRGSPRMYASDMQARDVANRAIAAGHDLKIDGLIRVFFYTPFHHSEELADQERAVELARSLGEKAVREAERHCKIIRRFGRFPHRNPILGRVATAEEQQYLDQGGYAG